MTCVTGVTDEETALVEVAILMLVCSLLLMCFRVVCQLVSMTADSKIAS